MQASFDSAAVLTVSGIVQAIVLSGALLSLRRGSLLANRLLAAFLGAMAICFGGLILAYTKYILAVPHLGQIHVPFGLLLAPLLFLYVRTLVFGEKALRRPDVLHFLPSALAVIYLLPFYVRDGASKISYLARALDNYPPDWRVRSAFVFLQGLIYLIFVYSLLRRKNGSENSTVPARDASLYLAKFFTVTFAFAWLVGLTRFLVAHRLETNLLSPLVGCVFVCGLIFKAIQKPEVLGAEAEREQILQRRYEKSTLKLDEAEKNLKAILDLMKIEKAYLDRNLTLEKTARKLSIAPAHLSQIINERLNQNFADFINSYRVEEFKERLSDTQNDRFTMVAIAEASGFNSKSTFNSAFKKHTNLTPSEFKKSLRRQS